MNLTQVRAWMRENAVDCVYFSCLDPHQSESVANHWKTVQKLTGFTGSNGWAYVTLEEAAFWTDGRYIEQAHREVDEGEFQIYCISIPTDPDWSAWVLQRIPEGGTLALDGSVISIGAYRALKAKLRSKNVQVTLDIGGILATWADRPAIPDAPLYELEPRFTCSSRPEKLAAVRARLPEAPSGEGWCLVNTLDDIVWLTNLRGHDNPLYPFYHAYALVSPREAFLCTDEAKIPQELKQALSADGFSLRPYGDAAALIAALPAGSAIRLDPAKTSASLFWAVPEGVRVDEAPELVGGIKAVKSPAEQENIREANLRESAAVVRLMMWIERAVGREPMDEYQVGQKLNEFRRMDPLYLQPANVPIVGYGANASVIHYRPTPKNSCPVRPEGFLLFDVCAQYRCGTTDLTRTVAVGALTDEMREDYTLVLKAHIRLATQKFPAGTTGNLLDAIVKAGHWNRMANYRHGTGHGIGYVSNVHEGPGKISTEFAGAFPYAFGTALVPGMLFSNEPGLYKPGRHGIRIENSVLVQDAGQTEFGRFMKMETVTFLPFENKAIVREMLTEEEIAWIRGYYALVRGKLAAFLTEAERLWLEEKTEF